MTVVSPSTIFLIGIVVTALLAIFVVASIRGLTKPPVPEVAPEEQLEHLDVDQHRPLKVLLAIDGSPTSLAAVGELTSCHLPRGSSITVLTVLHTAVPAIPDLPPWNVSILATHAELLRQQEQRAPALLEAVVKHLRPGRRHLDVTSKVVEGEPKDVILREAAEWGADRIVLGSHGYGKVRRAVLGSTAAGVAAEAPCSVYIVRAATSIDTGRQSEAVSAIANSPGPTGHGA